jgi:small subunit ribosomal protein S20
MVRSSAVAIRHASALKRHRQSEKRRQRNQAIKTRLRHLVREVRTAVTGRDSAAAKEHLARAERALQKAVTKGLLHKNNAARKAARLALAVNGMSARAAG